MARKTGVYEKIGHIDYFIPDPLPPHDPVLDFNAELAGLYGSAMAQVARLQEVAKYLPDANRLVKGYVIKEALLSSAIEGIHTTLIDAFTQPVEGVKISKETQLVLNYTKTLEDAWALIKNGLPISTRLILTMHESLMQHGGQHANPGNYRTATVRVGALVPPPAQYISLLMSQLEEYMHGNDSLPFLIRIGLVHVQFETIHPFLDGNGRIGRLLIILMLIDLGLLDSPILYISYYFKKNHQEYYKRLDAVRTEGDFEGWIKYYLQAVEASAIDAYKRINDIQLLEKEILNSMAEKKGLSKSAEVLAHALKILFKFPIVTVSELAGHLDKSYNVAKGFIDDLIELNVLVQAKEQKRNKSYRFDAYLHLLEKEY